MKECPKGKILNPKTGRCVNINGKIGNSLVNVTPNEENRLDNACKGKTKSQGGLNLSDLKKLVKDSKNKSRRELIDILCKEQNVSKCSKMMDFFEMKNGKYVHNVKITLVSNSLENIIIGNNIFSYNKTLGSGTYGSVFEFRSAGNQKIAVKMSEKTDKDDFYYHELMKKTGCKTIHMRKLNYNKYLDLFIMNSFTGSLRHFYKKVIHLNSDFKLWFKVMEEIRKMVLCLFKYGIYYTDLKPDNILYCDEGNGNYTFYLGDLGSAKIHDNGWFASTYNAPESYYHEHLIKGMGGAIQINKFMTYILAGVAVSFDNTIEHNLFYRDKQKKDIIKIVKDTDFIPSKTKKVLLKMLDLDPKKRPTIDKITLV